MPSAVGARSSYLGYRFLSRFAEILPLSAIGPISRLSGTLAAGLMKSRTALVRRHLGRVLRRDPSSREVRQVFIAYARYWLESFRLPVVPREVLEGRTSIEGYEHIEAARASGKGIILALPHMGNWDAAGAWLVAHGIPLTVVVERLQPEQLNTWFRDFRTSLGFSVVENGPTVVASLTGALHRNEAIALLCDRDVDGSGLPIEFFGEETPLPKGPVVLALRTGAALLPVTAYAEDGRYRLVVDAPVTVERQGTFRDDVTRITRELMGRIEKLIRVAPEQWHLLQPNWPSDRSGSSKS